MTRKRRTTQLERTAYHEAAHAVVAVGHEVAIKTVTIVPYMPAHHDEVIAAMDGKASGGVSFIENQFFSDRTEIRILLAGGIGQNMFRRDWFIFSLLGDASSDLYRVEQVALWNTTSRDRYDRLIKGEKKFVRSFLRKHWHRVERVAAALLEHKTLTGAQVQELCETAVQS